MIRATGLAVVLSCLLIIPALPPAARAPERGSRDSVENGAGIDAATMRSPSPSVRFTVRF